MTYVFNEKRLIKKLISESFGELLKQIDWLFLSAFILKILGHLDSLCLKSINNYVINLIKFGRKPFQWIMEN